MKRLLLLVSIGVSALWAQPGCVTITGPIYQLGTSTLTPLLDGSYIDVSLGYTPVTGPTQSVTRLTTSSGNFSTCLAPAAYTAVYVVKRPVPMTGTTSYTRTWTVPSGGPYTVQAIEGSTPITPLTIIAPSQISQGTATDGQCLAFNLASGSWLPAACGTGGGANPGGVNNSAQYRINSTTFGGVINTTATNKFFTQSSSGVPVWNTLVLGDLPTIPYSQTTGVQAALGFTPLNPANNLSDVLSAGSVRANLGLGTAAVQTGTSGALIGTTDTQTLTNKTLDGVTPATMAFVDPTSSIQTQLGTKQAALGFTPLNPANNLSDVGLSSTARTNLGLGSAAVQTGTTGALVGTTDTQTLTNKNLDGVTPATMAFVDPTSSIQTQLGGKQASLGFTPLNAASNLSDVASASTARTNLGLGSAAVQTGTTGALVGSTDTQTLTNKSISGATNTLSAIPAASLTGIVAQANGGTGVNNTATLTLGTSAVNLATLGTGIVKNTVTTGALTDAAAADIAGLFSGCSGSMYLGYDGACHAAAGAGTVTSVTGTAPIVSNGSTTVPALSCPTCVTSAAALPSNTVLLGNGTQATVNTTLDNTTTDALFATAGAPAFRAITGSDVFWGTLTYTSSHTQDATWCGKLIIMNPGTVTLVSPTPVANCRFTVQNDNALNPVTIAHGAVNIDGAPFNVVLPLCASAPCPTVDIWTDGTNYFTSSGNTNANNLNSGTVASARGGAGAITGALKGNGSGVVSQAACADLSNAGTGCSATLAAVATSGSATDLSTGTLAAARTAAFTGDVTKPLGSIATTVTALNGTSLAGLGTGILKNTTGTGVPSIAVAADFPTLNQNTTGTAASVTGVNAVANGGTGTASTLTGLVRGSASAMTAAELSGDATTSGSNAVTVKGLNGTSLAGLATGVLKNTTTTGVPSIAAAADVYGLWSGTCNSTTFLRGDGACNTPGGSGTVTVVGAGTLTNLGAMVGGGSQASQTSSQLTVANLGTAGTEAWTMTNTALATTPAGGYNLTNTTSAAVGAQQVSPPIVQTGQGWRTTANVSKSVACRNYVLPVQGSNADPTAQWMLDCSIAGGAYSNVLTVGQAQTGGATPYAMVGFGGLSNGYFNTGTGLYTSNGGTNTSVIDGSGNLILRSIGTLGFASGNLTVGSITEDTYLSRFAAATIQHGTADAATAVAQTIKFQGIVTGTTGNIAGQTATIKASSGVGSGVGGDLVFQTAKAGTLNATTPNTYATAFTISGTSGLPVLPSVTEAVLIALTATNGSVAYCSDCVSGTYDAAVASGGTGTSVLYENGAWRVH